MSARANSAFKAQYRKYLDVALSISLAVHLLAFALIPRLDINAFKTVVDELEVVEIPPEIEIPPPPKEIQRPKIPVETLDEDVEEEDEMEDTVLDMDNLPDAPPPPPPGGGTWSSYDKPPKIKFYSKPVYPSAARTAEIEGTVILTVTISTQGRVVDARVLSGHAMFHRSALDAIKQCVFEPAEMSGNPVQVVINVPMEFTLDR